MNFKNIVNTIRNTLILDENNSYNNTITIGYIIWGILLISIIIMIISLTIIVGLKKYELKTISIFILWFVGIYPAYKQYEYYKKNLAILSKETICINCKHFNSEAQLCSLIDKHIDKNNILCNGEHWQHNAVN